MTENASRTWSEVMLGVTSHQRRRSVARGMSNDKRQGEIEEHREEMALCGRIGREVAL